jgi:two-component system LytT family sensor kinase
MKRPLRWLYLLGGWTAVALILTSAMYLLFPFSRQRFSLVNELSWELTIALIWILSTPFVLNLARRIPIEGEKKIRNGIAHIALSIGISSLQCALHGITLALIRGNFNDITFSSIMPSFYYNIDKMIMIYWVIILFSYARDYYERYREKELRTAQLEAQLSRARLEALKMQLHPHFLFNTLNALTALVHKDPDKAEKMIVRLSDLLRLTLENSVEPFIPLHEEIEFLARYLEIEEIRYSDQLSVHIDVSPGAGKAIVPNLLLQPIVENAVKHGVSKIRSAGTIDIRGRRSNGRLVLSVYDNGPGLKNNPPSGIGLTNTRERLRQIYGGEGRLELRPNTPDGLCAEISIPFTSAKK